MKICKCVKNSYLCLYFLRFYISVKCCVCSLYCKGLCFSGCVCFGTGDDSYISTLRNPGILAVFHSLGKGCDCFCLLCFCCLGVIGNCLCSFDCFGKGIFCSFRILSCFCSLCDALKKCICFLDLSFQSFAFCFCSLYGYCNRCFLFIKFLKFCVIQMIFCKLAIFLTGKKRTDGDLCIALRSVYNKVFMLDHCVVGRFEVIVSLSFHDPRVIKIIICDDTCACFVICIVYPDSFSFVVQIHFLECVKVCGNAVRVGIVTFDTIEIMGFCVIHHSNFCVQLFVDIFYGNCDRDLFCGSYAFSCEGNDKICCRIFIIRKQIHRCSVSVDLHQVRITGGYCDLFIIEYILTVFIFDPCVTRKLDVTGTVRCIKLCLRCKILQLICCIIFIQNRL